MRKYCDACRIAFAVLEEKILWRDKIFHRRCLSMELRKKESKSIRDEDLKPYEMRGVYNKYIPSLK